MAQATAITSGQNYKSIRKAHTAALAALEIILLANRVLIARNATAANADNTFIHEAEIEAPKAAVTIAAGETAYWDDTAKVFTNVVGTNTKCGMFTEDAASGAAVAQIYLSNEVNL